jgi:hypothetical protein
MPQVLKLLGRGLTAAVMLSVPAFALSSFVSWGHASVTGGPDRPAIATSDDAVTNGFRIVAPPAVEPAKATPAPAGASEAETLLRDWQFTKLPSSQGS